jgi:putative oxidoreductase
MKYTVLLGRILYSLIFIMAIASHFSSGIVNYAEAKGVPMANILVPLSGVIAIIGGVSIALGYKARAGAWLLVVFLIPVTFYMHAFWKETDATQMHMQMANFMKNVGLLGGALLISYFGSGPASLDAYLSTPNKVVVKGFTTEDDKGS